MKYFLLNNFIIMLVCILTNTQQISASDPAESFTDSSQYSARDYTNGQLPFPKCQRKSICNNQDDNDESKNSQDSSYSLDSNVMCEVHLNNQFDDETQNTNVLYVKKRKNISHFLTNNPHFMPAKQVVKKGIDDEIFKKTMYPIMSKLPDSHYFNNSSDVDTESDKLKCTQLNLNQSSCIKLQPDETPCDESKCDEIAYDEMEAHPRKKDSNLFKSYLHNIKQKIDRYQLTKKKKQELKNQYFMKTIPGVPASTTLLTFGK